MMNVMKFIHLIQYMIGCYQAYKRVESMNPKFFYFTLTRYGVPKTVVIVGQDREAWRVSDFAINYLASRGN